MTEAEYLACEDPAEILLALRRRSVTPDVPVPSDRKLRLWACACVRGYPWPEPLLAHELRLIDDAERHADGGPKPVHGPGAYKAGVSILTSAPEKAARMWAVREPNDDTDEEIARRAALLRDIVGNPFRRYAWSAIHDPAPSGHDLQFLHTDWLTPDVLNVAGVAYETRDWSGLPALADALEESGCENAYVLGHLRGPGPHARGCWAIDCMLGKE